MKENNVISLENPDQLHDPLTDLLKSGARQFGILRFYEGTPLCLISELIKSTISASDCEKQASLI